MSKLTKIQEERLTKLGKRLVASKIGHEQFDFGSFNRLEDGGGCPNKCGYAGCALGECPIVFPEDWKYNQCGEPVLRRSKLNSWESANKYFGVNDREASHLFMPDDQLTEEYGGKDLPCDATPQDVGKNMLNFVKIKKIKAKLVDLLGPLTLELGDDE